MILLSVVTQKHARIYETPSSATVERWLNSGNVHQLEKFLFNGNGELLFDKQSTNEKANEFLAAIKEYSVI